MHYNVSNSFTVENFIVIQAVADSACLEKELKFIMIRCQRFFIIFANYDNQ